MAWIGELGNELEELEELKEVAEGVVVVVEGLWTFLGLSQPNLLKPLTGGPGEQEPLLISGVYPFSS